MDMVRISKKAVSIVIIAAFVLALSFTGCRAAEAARDEMAVTEAMDAIEEAPAMEMTEGKAVADEEMVYSDDVQYSDTDISVDRKVIKSAYLELEIEKGKFEKVIFDITSLAENNSGFVSQTQSYSDSDGNLTSGNITIRIPHDQYNSALEAVRNMGTVESISVSGEDVTQEYTDLESRLRNLEAQEKILLDLMDESKDVSDSIEVQRELSNVQEQIEVIKGKMKYLDNMVSYSTIQVYLYEPQPITDDSGWGFMDALRRGVRGAVTVFNAIMIFVIAASPIIAFIAIILVIIWLIVRARIRRRNRK